MRPHDLATQMVPAALTKVPELEPREIEDPILATAQPAGEGATTSAVRSWCSPGWTTCPASLP
jgi:hypothetical protein